MRDALARLLRVRVGEAVAAGLERERLAVVVAARDGVVLPLGVACADGCVPGDSVTLGAGVNVAISSASPPLGPL